MMRIPSDFGVWQTTCNRSPTYPIEMRRGSGYGNRTSSRVRQLSQSKSLTSSNGSPRSRAFFALLAGSNSIFTRFDRNYDKISAKRRQGIPVRLGAKVEQSEIMQPNAC
jgi:hypothetical protein